MKLILLGAALGTAIVLAPAMAADNGTDRLVPQRISPDVKRSVKPVTVEDIERGTHTPLLDADIKVDLPNKR